jgi:hypothetical protein
MTLIGSDKVEGTAVYGADEGQIGSIERVMIDKRSGKVSYAVLSFGGFLGIGDDHYPLPWESLKYDTGLGGYRTGITEKQLQGAPKYGSDNDWSWEDRTRTRGVDDYYGVITTRCVTIIRAERKCRTVPWGLAKSRSRAGRRTTHTGWRICAEAALPVKISVWFKHATQA